MDVSILGMTAIRALMSAAALVLVYRFARAGGNDRHARDSGSDSVLAVLALLSVALHFNVNFFPPGLTVHEHEFFHYYLGAKYSPEVGYSDLYPSVVVADTENNRGMLRFNRVREMEDYRLVPARSIIERGDEYRSLFTESRWEAFRKDVANFQARLSERTRWAKVVQDHGYNATPVWNATGYLLTNLIPSRGPFGIPVLVALDVILIGLMCLLLRSAFGRRTMLMAIVFLGTMFVMAPGHIRVAFLRFDWLTLLVMATCLIKLGRYKTAGACVAYAGMVRIFPLVFVFGMGARWIWDLAATRRLSRRYVGFFATFFGGVAVCFALSIVVGDGLDGWREFWAKISHHDEQLFRTAVGFKYVLLSLAGDGSEAAFARLWLPWWIVQAVVLAGVFFAARFVEDYESVPLGYVLAYFLVAPTFYYQVMLLVASLFFLPKLDRRGRAHGAALVLGVSVVGYVVYVLDNLDLKGISWQPRPWPEIDSTLATMLSYLLLVVSIYLATLAVRERSGPTPPGWRSSRAHEPEAPQER